MLLLHTRSYFAFSEIAPRKHFPNIKLLSWPWLSEPCTEHISVLGQCMLNCYPFPPLLYHRTWSSSALNSVWITWLGWHRLLLSGKWTETCWRISSAEPAAVEPSKTDLATEAAVAPQRTRRLSAGSACLLTEGWDHVCQIRLSCFTPASMMWQEAASSRGPAVAGKLWLQTVSISGHLISLYFSINLAKWPSYDFNICTHFETSLRCFRSFYSTLHQSLDVLSGIVAGFCCCFGWFFFFFRVFAQWRNSERPKQTLSKKTRGVQLPSIHYHFFALLLLQSCQANQTEELRLQVSFRKRVRFKL